MSLGVEKFDPITKPVQLTPAAIAHIKKELTKTKAVGLRLGVKKAGCSGLKYVVDYVREINASDQTFEIDNLTIFIDKQSIPALSGLTVDYVREGLNGHLKFLNPNEKGSCGCGESFMV